MKIALIGYGKMGHIIEKIALARGHEIVCAIDADNRNEFDSDGFRSADCAIEFSTPASAVENIKSAFAQGVPVVCGTTGWLSSLPEIKEMCAGGKATFLYASNFSVGVNIFMAINRYLASIMNGFPQYTPHMVETHHIHKLDHPSGTAITLAEQIAGCTDRISGWCEPDDSGKCPFSAENGGSLMQIDHIRSGEVPGIHTIDWVSDVDSISITHSAKSREGFALGAVLAAEWLSDKKGFHEISEVFKF